MRSGSCVVFSGTGDNRLQECGGIEQAEALAPPA
jgi:hypothetical protein